MSYATPFRITVLLLFLWVPGAADAQESSVSGYMDAGDAAFEALDNQTAVAHFEAARREGGEPTFDLLTRLSRTHTDYSLDLIAAGRRDQGETEIETALSYAEMLTEQFPDRAESWFLRAISYGNLATFRGGKEKVRIGRAVEEYCLRAIELDPHYAPSYIVLGVFYREVAEVSWIQRLVANTLFGGLPEGSYQRSAELLRKAIELDPAIPLAQFELGRTLFRDARLDEARPHLVAGATLDPLSTLDIRNANEALRLLALVDEAN